MAMVNAPQSSATLVLRGIRRHLARLCMDVHPERVWVELDRDDLLHACFHFARSRRLVRALATDVMSALAHARSSREGFRILDSFPNDCS